jgi:hypothetical protein
VFKIRVLLICSVLAIGLSASAGARADSLQLVSNTGGVLDYRLFTIDILLLGNGIVVTGSGDVISAILTSQALSIGCFDGGVTSTSTSESYLSTIPGVCAVGSIEGFEVTLGSARAGPVNLIINGASTDTVSAPVAAGVSTPETSRLLLLGSGLLGLVGSLRRKNRWVALLQLLRLKPRRPNTGPASTGVGLQR